MRSAEVVAIGAGVIGASVAYRLRERGCDSVLVLERHREPGRGSTSRFGQLLAEVILDGAAHTLDTRSLRSSRFAEGEPNLAPTLFYNGLRRRQYG